MKRFIAFTWVMLLTFSLSACGEENNLPEIPKIPTEQLDDNGDNPENDNNQTDDDMNETQFHVKMKVGNRELTATLLNNATTRAFVAKLPTTLPMMDLYDREMCYRFPEALPTDDVNTCGYKVGEIVYYPPMHSFVILYAQNGEHFSMQKLGRMDSGVELFRNTGDVNVTFELIK